MDWQRILDNFGVPVFVMCVLGSAIAVAARFVWKDVVIPFRDKLLARAMAFFDKLDRSVDQIRVLHTESGATLVRLEDILWRIEGELQEVQDSCERTELILGTEPPPRRQRPHRRPHQQQQQPTPPPPSTLPPAEPGSTGPI